MSHPFERHPVLARLAAEAEAAPTPRSALRKLGALRAALDAFEQQQVATALEEGVSYAAIAQDLGLTRQSAHRRFHRLAPREAVASDNGKSG